MVKPNESIKGRPAQSADSPFTTDRGLDRNSDVPLYFQLGAMLKVRLEAGTWEAGARFASERELEEEFGVSRAVIRPALELLVGDGAIFRVKGSGAFVAPPRREVRVTGLVRLALERPDGPAVRVVSARERRPDNTVSRFLGIEDPETLVTYVTAVVDVGTPSALVVDSFSTTALVPWLLPTARALQMGGEPSAIDGPELTRATVSIEHTFFSEWASSQVGATAGDAVLMGRFVQYGRAQGSQGERPLEFARLLYRAETTQLAFELS